MVNPFICGSSSLHVDEDDMDFLMSPTSTPKRSSLKKSNNPYANRGLDRFSALLAELEDKKQKIYTQAGADEISIVRFVFNSNSNDAKPIVVKLKGKKENETTKEGHNCNNNVARTKDSAEKVEVVSMESNGQDSSSKKKFPWKVNVVKWEDLKKPRFYLPLAIILILVFLAIYGRTFAILCTSIGWYVIPTIRVRSLSSSSSFNNSRKVINNNKQQKRKEYVRRFSEKNMSSPKSVDSSSTSPKSVLTGGHHAHRKSF